MKLIKVADRVAIPDDTVITRISLLERCLNEDTITWPKNKKIKYAVWMEYRGGSVNCVCEDYASAEDWMNKVMELFNKKGKK